MVHILKWPSILDQTSLDIIYYLIKNISHCYLPPLPTLLCAWRGRWRGTLELKQMTMIQHALDMFDVSTIIIHRSVVQGVGVCRSDTKQSLQVLALPHQSVRAQGHQGWCRTSIGASRSVAPRSRRWQWAPARRVLFAHTRVHQYKIHPLRNSYSLSGTDCFPNPYLRG
jgi:hypothetical protein